MQYSQQRPITLPAEQTKDVHGQNRQLRCSMKDGKGKEERKNSIAIDTGKIESIGDYRCPEDLYQGLIRRVRKYHPSDDISLIEKAYEVARKAHEGSCANQGSLISFIRCMSPLFWRTSNWIRKPLPPGFCMMWWRTQS